MFTNFARWWRATQTLNRVASPLTVEEFKKACDAYTKACTDIGYVPVAREFAILRALQSFIDGRGIRMENDLRHRSYETIVDYHHRLGDRI
jgi:hypothetical protein